MSQAMTSRYEELLDLEREICDWCQRAGRVTDGKLIAAACRSLLAAAAGLPVETEDADEDKEVVELLLITEDDDLEEAFDDGWGGGPA
jgi:hypothetical protein